jgi:hypothetical protein
MSSITRSTRHSAFLLRSVAVAALLSATSLIGAPAFATEGDTASSSVAAKSAHHRAGETVEQRIAALHKSLKITADEESNWSAVAQAMRENDAAMRSLVAARSAQSPQNVSAVDDLKTYEKFTQAHVDGLKNLIASFETLYNAMPESQKMVADQVFQSFGHHRRAS